MKKKILSLFMAGISMAMFGILYPEYILLPDTYEYITEKSPGKVYTTCGGKEIAEDLTDLLYENPENVRISSKLLQILEEEGTVIWRSKN